MAHKGDNESQKQQSIDNYTNELDDFKKNITKLYTYAGHTFVTSKEAGDRETFYMHALRHYMHVHTVYTLENTK